MAPGAPTSVSAAAGNTQATVSFTAPSFTGVPAGVTGYLATSDPDGVTKTGSASPLTVTGLTNGTSYTFTVQATNGIQYGPAGTSGGVTPAVLQRILYFGGNSGSNINVIEYIDPSSTGNGTDFGDMLLVGRDDGGVGSNTRAVLAANAVLSYVEFASTGNATDFGDLNFSVGNMAGAGSNTRGLFVGGSYNNIDYITIANTGNATDFGNLSGVSDDTAGALASATRAVIGKVGTANGAGTSQLMVYVTIANTGNSTDFGTLSGGTRKQNLEGASSSTRGLFAGGYRSYPSTVYYNNIEYITIASTGDTSDFGDLNAGLDGGAFGSGATRAVFAGGYNGSTSNNVMQYVTIATTGNTTDFGDLTASKVGMGAASSVHGGNV
tara:strand:- start:1050 stop:2192 length:1143 start_codon:yes stop_codon:yes gene_type:complete